jgi:hypothetical protein
MPPGAARTWEDANPVTSVKERKNNRIYTEAVLQRDKILVIIDIYGPAFGCL